MDGNIFIIQQRLKRQPSMCEQYEQAYAGDEY